MDDGNPGRITFEEFMKLGQSAATPSEQDLDNEDERWSAPAPGTEADGAPADPGDGSHPLMDWLDEGGLEGDDIIRDMDGSSLAQSAAESSIRSLQQLGFSEDEMLSAFLMEAVSSNDLAEVDRLVALGASPEDPVPEALIGGAAHAAQVGNPRLIHFIAADPEVTPETLEHVLQYAGDVNVPDGRGLAPLHQAAMSTTQEHVRILLGAGADPNALTNEGSRPDVLASAAGRTENVALLMQARQESYHVGFRPGGRCQEETDRREARVRRAAERRAAKEKNEQDPENAGRMAGVRDAARRMWERNRAGRPRHGGRGRDDQRS